MVETSRVYGRSRHAPPQGAPAQLTVRGAVIVLLLTTLLGTLIGELFTVTWLTGVLFVIGALVVTWLVRRDDLHLLVVAPPLVYFVSLLIVEMLVSLGGGFLQSLVVGIVGNLSAIAPWLLIGTAGAVALAWYRGLPAAYTAFRARLRADDEQPDLNDGLPVGYSRPRPIGDEPVGSWPEPAGPPIDRPDARRGPMERSDPAPQPAPQPSSRRAQPTARYTAAPSYAPGQTPMTPRYANAPNGYQRRPGRHSGS